MASLDGEQYHVVDVTGAQNGAFIREKVYAKVPQHISLFIKNSSADIKLLLVKYTTPSSSIYFSASHHGRWIITAVEQSVIQCNIV